MAEKITVKDLLERDIDIDVFDDCTEDLSIGFVGPVKLTDYGKEHFSEALELPVEIEDDGTTAIVCVSNRGDWSERLNLATELFQAAAGYCSEATYARYFKES